MKDKPLPSIPVEPAHREVYQTRIPTREYSRIRAWRAPDIEQQTAEWRKRHAQECYDLDQYWKTRMRGRP
jgi:hypothetical protein